MSLPKSQREIGLVVEAMLAFANDLPNRESDPLKIAPGGLLKLLLERGLRPDLGDASTQVYGPMATSFASTLAHAEGELVRRGVHAIALWRGGEPGLDYREERIRPKNLRVWRDERIVTDIVKPGAKADAQPAKKPARGKQAA